MKRLVALALAVALFPLLLMGESADIKDFIKNQYQTFERERGEKAFKVAQTIMDSIGEAVNFDGTKSDAAYLYGGEEGRNLLKMSHMNTSCPELSFHCEGERYAIAHLDKGEGTVDVRFDHQSAASCTMTWDVEDWRGSHPYLVDNMTGTVIDMARMSSYAFEAGSHEHPFRFKLVLEDGFEAPGLVISNLEGEGIAQIIDMNGRLLLTQEFNSSLPTPHSQLLTPHSSLLTPPSPPACIFCASSLAIKSALRRLSFDFAQAILLSSSFKSQ